MERNENMNTANWSAELTGRVSKAQITHWARTLHHDAENIESLLALLLRSPSGRVGMNAAWLLSHLSEEDKVAYLLPHRDELIDFVMWPDIRFRHGLVLSILLGMPVPEELRTDFLDFCMDGLSCASYHDSCRSYMIRLAASMCRPYPELQEEFRQRLLLLPDGVPPSVASARERALKGKW